MAPDEEAAGTATEAAEAPESPQPAPKRKHRFSVGTLFVLAVVITVFAVVAVWVNRQVLNTNNVVNTSSQILANKEVQVALSAYLVNELFKSVNVTDELKSALPPQLQGVSGPLAAGFKQVAGTTAPALLATSQVQNAFKKSVRVAHASFIDIVNGGKVAKTTGGVVTLNLNELIAVLGSSLGVSSSKIAAAQSGAKSAGPSAKKAAQSKLGVTIPASSGQLVLFRSSQLKALQDIVKWLRHLAIALPLIALALFALAIRLAEGRRRRAFRLTGWCLIGIGVIVLLIRRVGINAVVNSLVKIESNKPAVHNVLTIGTTLLYDIATALIFYGAFVVIAAWIAGSTRPATALRRALAPTLRDHPVRVYAALAGFYLLLILWEPTPAFRQWPALVIFAALLVFGMELLRRQTARECPDAKQGDAMKALRGWYAARTRTEVEVVSPTGNGSEQVEAIERLAALHDRGVLSDDEFAAEKSALINGS